MNDLPLGWSRATLPELVALDGVFADGDWVESKDQDPSGDVRLIQLADIGDGYYRDRSARFLTLAKAHQLGCTFLAQGDILIARMPDPLGRACCFPGDTKRAVTAVDVCIMRPGTGSVNPKWLMHTINAPQLRSAMAAYEKGTTRKRISRSNIARLWLPIPPLAEQGRIVAAIEEQFSRLDAGVAALERARQSIRRIRAAFLEAAVSSAEGRTTPKLPLGDLVAPGRKIAYGVLVPGDHDPDGVPFVRVGDLSNRQVNTQNLKHIAPAIAARYPRTRLNGGEVLLSLVGTIGRTAVVAPELAGANTARALAVIPVKEAVEPRYVAIALSRERVVRELTDLSHEVARKTLNLEDVRKYEIPLPGYSEQLEIVKAVETEETWIGSVEEVVARTFRRADHLRSSILRNAFSGRLVPQDESEEPASVLLARIATERASADSYRLPRSRKPRVRRGETTS